MQNPALVKYLGEVSPFLDSFTIELYGEVSKSAVNMLKATGTPTKRYDTELGFIRDLTPLAQITSCRPPLGLPSAHLWVECGRYYLYKRGGHTAARVTPVFDDVL